MPTLLSAILDDVAEVTRRPDARTRALLSANTIIMDICNNADYPDDLVEVSLPNPTPGSYVASIPLILPTFPARRKIEYILAGGIPLTCIKPRDAVSNSGCSWKDAYYRVGEILQISATKQFDSIVMGYYKQTGTLTETSTHWLLDQAPMMVLSGIVASVFRATGDETSGNEYEAQYRMLRKQFRAMIVDSEVL